MVNINTDRPGSRGISVLWPSGAMPPGASMTGPVHSRTKYKTIPKSETSRCSSAMFTKRNPKPASGEPLLDLSPRLYRSKQLRNSVRVQSTGVPVLRDVLEVLTCNSSEIQRGRTFFADRARMLESAIARQGVVRPTVDLAIASSRRYRKPDQINAHFAVHTPTLQQTDFSHLTDFTKQRSYTTISVPQRDKMLQESRKSEDEESRPNTSGAGITVNIIPDEPKVPRENIPTIDSGKAGAPPTPPPSPEPHRPFRTPMENSLRHNSATYSYRKNEKRNRIDGITETNQILLRSQLEYLQPFPITNNKKQKQDKYIRIEQSDTNVPSTVVLHQLYGPKDDNSPVPTVDHSVKPLNRRNSGYKHVRFGETLMKYKNLQLQQQKPASILRPSTAFEHFTDPDTTSTPIEEVMRLNALNQTNNNNIDSIAREISDMYSKCKLEANTDTMMKSSSQAQQREPIKIPTVQDAIQVNMGEEVTNQNSTKPKQVRLLLHTDSKITREQSYLTHLDNNSTKSE